MNREMKTMTAAKAVVTCLKREAVKHVFCVPGESYLPVLDALYDEPSIRVISARHEGGAAFMAESYSKTVLKPGIVFATRGVGAANLSIGVHTAYQDSTPMIVFLGQVHSGFRGREGFQEVDLAHYFQPIAKWTYEVKDQDRVPEIVQRAFRIAQSGRPGPVVISLPEDVLPKEAAMRFGPPVVKPAPAPAVAEMKKVEEMLKAASFPLIIAGGGIKSARAEDALLAFAETFHIPVMAAFRRHDAFPNDHHLYAGHLGLGVKERQLKTIKKADFIIAIGTRLSEVTTQDYSIITEDKKLLHIDIDFDTLGKVYAPDLGIVADATEALRQMQKIECNKKWGSWAAETRKAYEEFSALRVSEADVINKYVIKIMKEKLPENALITNDAGNFAGWLHTFYSFTEKHSYIGPTSGAMGYGMPAALGAKLATPEKTVVALAGDGGFMMTVQELETAVRCGIPVICLVFNNQMYGTIRMHQEMHYPEKVIGTDLGEISFAALARSVGADGYSVNTKEEFADLFTKVLASKQSRPVVIEIMTDPEQISVAKTIGQIRSKRKS